MVHVLCPLLWMKQSKMYAAVRLDRNAVQSLMSGLTKALRTTHRKGGVGEFTHETLDIVLISNGCVSVEDDGCIAIEHGVVLDYQNDNVNAFAHAIRDPNHNHDVYE